MQLLFVLAVFLLIVGCGEKSRLIEQVKNAPLNNSLTYLQAFESTPYCTDSEWKTEKDSRNRDVVIHSCSILITKDQVLSNFEKEKIDFDEAIIYSGLSYSRDKLANEKNKYEQRENSKNSEMSRLVDEITGDSQQESLEEIAESIKAMQADYDSDVSMLMPIVDEYNSILIEKASIKELHVDRISKFVILPNNIEWISLEFYANELDRTYKTGGQWESTLPIDHITGTTRRIYPNPNDSIFDILVKQLYNFKNFNHSEDFKALLSSKCDHDGCPLAIMITSESWQNYFKITEHQ